MNYKSKTSYYTFFALLGLIIPIFPVIRQLHKSNQSLTLDNFFHFLSSDGFYVIGFIVFPFLSVFIFQLVQQVVNQKKYIEEEFSYLKVLLNANPDAIIFLNEDQEVIFQNNQFSLLFDKYESIVEQANINSFFSQVEYIQKEVVLDSSFSENHPFLMSFKLARFQNSKNYFMSFKDIKSLKDKERIIEDQNDQMVEKNKLAALGEMAAGIAHEVNNPLTVIHSNNMLINNLAEKDKLSPEKVIYLVTKTKNQIERITAIITSLRNLSRGLANEGLEEFPLGQVIHEAISLAKIRDKSKSIIFQFNNERINAFGNRGQIVQVVLNLLNNAIDAIEEMDDPWIAIKLIDKGKHVNLIITDSGPGITNDLIEKIFLPMYTTKEVGKGTGLGLSLSKTFIEQNFGSLKYINNGKNTCFQVSLLKESNDSKIPSAA